MTIKRRSANGTTLLEAMIAMGVILIGFLGMMGTNNLGGKLNSSARTMTRATAIAQDLVEQIGLWSYNDPRLADGVHTEADLTLGNATWSGIPTAVVRDGVPFTRTWTVTRTDDVDGNGTPDNARVVINVTGTSGVSGTGSVTLYLVKKNPAER
jgi:Tfp pilus assembly protein PilV